MPGHSKCSLPERRPPYDTYMSLLKLSASQAARDRHYRADEPLLTAAEIRDAQFQLVRTRPGYDFDEVDALLDRNEAVFARREGLTS